MIIKNIIDGVHEDFTDDEIKSLEKNKETSRVNNGVAITIYQGDEPVTEIIEEEPTQHEPSPVDEVLNSPELLNELIEKLKTLNGTPQ